MIDEERQEILNRWTEIIQEQAAMIADRLLTYDNKVVISRYAETDEHDKNHVWIRIEAVVPREVSDE